MSSFSICTRFAAVFASDWNQPETTHRAIAHRLLTDGFDVVSISSLALARFREASFGTWDKNDPKDAQVLLAMMAQGLVQVYGDPLFSGAMIGRNCPIRTFRSL